MNGRSRSPQPRERYLDILQALFIVFLVPPWHGNVARALLESPKLYFFDTELVNSDEGARFENAVATMLLKHVQFLQDTRGQDISLHYLRTKDGAEEDFCIAGAAPLQLIECKLADNVPHRALTRVAAQFAAAEAVQLVRDLRLEEQRGAVHVVQAAPRLARLAA